ncbi:hypothetical protein LWE61_05175 [Sphingobium sufflavum]|uniref:hypothetical protein n=1 Tax=Sphingobium sufflavum TaxID=1129547 RepID=UPI001F1F6D60|nr:hypothetical protein [Sphingobium sufflavum]MCE7795952.1 hypothetical protein [Sphingobium sufflavum]
MAKAGSAGTGSAGADSVRVDGAYDCITKTPMGDQASVFTIVTSGDGFQGTNASPLGSLEVKEGKVDGNRLSWRMETSFPMPMNFKCEGLLNGDLLTASIDAGTFGIITMSGKRRG